MSLAWLVCGVKLWLRFNRVWLFPKTNFYSQVQTIFTFCLVAGTMLFIYFQCMDQFWEMQQIRKCWPKSMSGAYSMIKLTGYYLLPLGNTSYFILLAPTSTSVLMREAGEKQLSGTNSQNKNINLNGNLRRRSHHCQHLHWRTWLLNFGLNLGWKKLVHLFWWRLLAMTEGHHPSFSEIYFGCRVAREYLSAGTSVLSWWLVAGGQQKIFHLLFLFKAERFRGWTVTEKLWWNKEFFLRLVQLRKQQTNHYY